MSRSLTITRGRRFALRAGLGCVLALSAAVAVGTVVPAAAASTVAGVQVSGSAQFKASGQTIGLSLNASSTNAGTGAGASGSCQAVGGGYLAQCVTVTGVTRGTGSATNTATVTGTAQGSGQRGPVPIRIVVTDNANPNGAGRDTVTITLDGRTAAGTVSTGNLTVTGTAPAPPANNPPVAKDDGVYEVPGTRKLEVAAPGVLGNDTDADGDRLTAVLVTPPARGQLDLRGDGSFTYTTDGSFAALVTFTYAATDGKATSNPATVQIGVQS